MISRKSIETRVDLKGDARMSRFGEKLTSLRTARGLTVKKVCEQVSIPQSRLSELERGVRIPTPGQIDKLEKYFEIGGGGLAELVQPD